MAVLTPTNLSSSGVAATLASAGGSGDSFTNDGQTFLMVANANGSAIDVTIAAQTTSAVKPGFEDVTYSNKTVNIANGATKIIGPFATGTYNDTNGRVQVTYSASSGVTVAAFRCNPKG